uniref:Uncharacterized protein n=1 Tax=Cucumis melo TaxID=3656 RepID=A0A9I9E3W3_CUCME
MTERMTVVAETERERELSAAGGWRRNGNGWRPRRTNVC